MRHCFDNVLHATFYWENILESPWCPIQIQIQYILYLPEFNLSKVWYIILSFHSKIKLRVDGALHIVLWGLRYQFPCPRVPHPATCHHSGDSSWRVIHCHNVICRDPGHWEQFSCSRAQNRDCRLHTVSRVGDKSVNGFIRKILKIPKAPRN